MRKRAHGLHAFGIKGGLALGLAVSDVPVLGGHDLHVHHHEWHVECQEGCRGAAATAYGHGSGGLAGNGRPVGVEEPLDDGHERPVRLPVIYRGADYERISLLHLLRDPVADVIVEDAPPGTAAFAAGYAAADGLCPEPEDLALDAFRFQRPCNLA